MGTRRCAFILLISALPAFAASRGASLSFEANHGQTDHEVKFLARTARYTLFLTANEGVFAFHTGPTAPVSIVRMKLLNESFTNAVGSAALDAKSNYFIGSDPKKWLRNVPLYGEVHYSGVYPGTDLIFYGNEKQLEYDFAVAPGGDPGRISLGFEGDGGPARLRITREGDLVIGVRPGEIRFRKPIVYQASNSRAGQRQLIDGRFVLRGQGRIGFAVGPYDRTKDLVIDPVLTYSTYLGGKDDEGIFGIKLDAKGNIYLAGETSSINFPTEGAFQDKLGGYYDGFISKFDPTGSRLIYSTYLGGSAYDHCAALALDPSGDAYVTGITQSLDFPIANAFQSTLRGTGNAFISRLDPTGQLLFSSFLGGSGLDQGEDIALDKHGNAYVTGGTNSPDFPVTPGAYATACDRGSNAGQCLGDAFVAKISGSKLVYSTFLGGTAQENGQGIAVDRSGAAYITGQTLSSDFPLKNPFQSSLAGPANVFVTKLNPSGDALEFSTYLGGNGFDAGFAVALDVFNEIYITGFTGSSNFPLEHPFQSAPKAPGTHGFLTKFAWTGQTLSYSTYLSGSSSDYAWRITVDALGEASVIGFTSSTDFPVVNALQPKYGGGNTDAFVSKFDPIGRPEYSTYLGGKGDEYGYAINADMAGNVWVGGSTSSRDYPLVRAFQKEYAGGPFDAFLTKISISPAQSIEVLAGAVLNFVVEGVLSGANVPSLLIDLLAAEERLRNGDSEGARESLEKFCRTVEKLVAARELGTSEGEQLCTAERDISARVAQP